MILFPTHVPPGLIIFLGALLAALLPRRARPYWLGVLPIAALLHVWQLSPGTYAAFTLFGLDFVGFYLDPLARIFATIFCIAALVNLIYAQYFKDSLQDIAGMAYAGAAIGAVFAGDLLSLFVWWELTAMTSVVLIWCVPGRVNFRAGTRYLIIQVISGLLLFAGAVLLYQGTGSIAFKAMTLSGPGPTLIFLAFGIKCAFPLLHNWLQDAYPKASISGTVWLSAFSTKLAVYALARGFAGTELLIPIGAVMTVFPIFYAVIENDLRNVLTYSLNNQLGFMVVGIGIGTELSLNGTAAHAFCHILYKALLFMSIGAVMLRVGTAKATELGGLYKTMPLTAMFCIVGSLSISAFPFFSGFVSKSMIVSAAAQGHYLWVWLVLIFASAGVLHHSGIKIPFFAFFAHDSGKRPEEAPKIMLLAMGIVAAFCILIGLAPGLLYAMLPYPVDFEPYTGAHLVTQFQLFFFSVLAFGWLMRRGHYPPEVRAINLDFDWIYREALPGIVRPLVLELAAARDALQAQGRNTVRALLEYSERTLFGRQGTLGATPLLGNAVMWTVIMLTIALLIYFAA